MRKLLMLLTVMSVAAQPVAVFADDMTTVEKTETTTEGTYTNPLTEVVIFPVRLVTGVIGAPIGAVGGLFTGFVKGFNWPGGNKSTQTSQRSTTTTAE
jgi:hypothetical protein